MQSCLEPLWEYCIEFLPVQCFPKSIKRTLHRIFSYTNLSGASCTTLHRVCPKSIKEWLHYFTIHDPTIGDPTMQDSSINYSNMFKLCRENLNHILYRTNDLIVAPRENTFQHDNKTNLAVFFRLISISERYSQGKTVFY